MNETEDQLLDAFFAWPVPWPVNWPASWAALARSEVVLGSECSWCVLVLALSYLGVRIATVALAAQMVAVPYAHCFILHSFL
eukprot:1160127-Pelagomonas_calceolata.AAC.4